jgi:hypothetical protein
MSLSALPAPSQHAALEGQPFIVGIGQSIHDPANSVDAMRPLGVQALRIDAPWESIERAPGQYRIPDWLQAVVESANAAGIEPLLIFAYGNRLYGGDKPRTRAAIEAFARYAAYVTRHFNGRVRYFDLWNEWNTSTGRTTPGTADDYVALARRVYPAVKAENPVAILLSGGTTSSGLQDGWLERFIAIGGLLFVDGLSLHPYNYREKTAATPEAALTRLDRAHALMQAAGHPLPIFVTEMGYPSYDGPGGVSEETAALYLTRFILLASARPYVAGVWWYCLRDHGTDPGNKEHHFGVLDPGLQAKPAAAAMRSVTRMLAEAGRLSNQSVLDQSVFLP